jgi:DNA-binding NtrC family response regulator
LHAAETGRSLVLTPDAEKALLAYSWPGNVRELENVIERAVVMSSSERISTDALMLRAEPIAIAQPSASPRGLRPMKEPPPGASEEQAVPALPETAAATEAAVEGAVAEQAEGEPGAPVSMEGTLQEFLDRAAALRIRKAIDSAKGNRNAAATALGIDRTTLYRLMRRLGL